MKRNNVILHLKQNDCEYHKTIGQRSFYRNKRKKNRVVGIDQREDCDDAYVYWICKTLLIDQPEEITKVAQDMDAFNDGAEREFKKA